MKSVEIHVKRSNKALHANVNLVHTAFCIKYNYQLTNTTNLHCLHSKLHIYYAIVIENKLLYIYQQKNQH